MKLKTRFSSSGFIEITCDSNEETIFKNSEKEIDILIQNPKETIDDLETFKEQIK